MHKFTDGRVRPGFTPKMFKEAGSQGHRWFSVLTSQGGGKPRVSWERAIFSLCLANVETDPVREVFWSRQGRKESCRVGERCWSSVMGKQCALRKRTVEPCVCLSHRSRLLSEYSVAKWHIDLRSRLRPWGPNHTGGKKEEGSLCGRSPASILGWRQCGPSWPSPLHLFSTICWSGTLSIPCSTVLAQMLNISCLNFTAGAL